MFSCSLHIVHSSRKEIVNYKTLEEDDDDNDCIYLMPTNWVCLKMFNTSNFNRWQGKSYGLIAILEGGLILKLVLLEFII